MTGLTGPDTTATRHTEATSPQIITVKADGEALDLLVITRGDAEMIVEDPLSYDTAILRQEPKTGAFIGSMGGMEIRFEVT